MTSYYSEFDPYAARCGKSDDATLNKVVDAFVGFGEGDKS